ncbi:hypothetical protein [Natronorubrum tibetense]|uniref:Uncharacterized protein n=1 Tax=Natronorubrum tibetense GA33 TaxID=1114856 RepID=L9VSB6_9EURY|nr:hypothetical protein [Natronorubrum tibetense]ELY39153.1 hypothetical protein C496_14887 [Natronorubrum tibetense GA33]
MGVFEIDSNEFEDGPEFNRYLSRNYSGLSSEDLYIISGVTELTQTEFENRLEERNWEVDEEYGVIKKIGRQYSPINRAEAYLHFDEEKDLIFFYTDQRKTEEINDAIVPLFRKISGVHYLYISPRILKKVTEQIAEQNDSAKVTEFIAKRTKGTEIPAAERPDKERTINYYGDDGLRTLREVEEQYGVLPHILEISIPDELDFRMDKEGVFKLKSGSLHLMFHYIDECINRCLDIKNAYDSTRINEIEISEGNRVSQSTPARIELDLKYEDLEPLQASLQGSDYALIDTTAERGSVYFSSKIYDQDSNLFFNIRADENAIRVFPREKREISTFFRFFEIVQSTVDEYAEAESIDYPLAG